MRLLVMATLWLLAPTSWGGETILQRLDHFYAASTQPEQLYTFFNETLGIPAVWQYQSYGSFASGGVTFGNAVFETVLFPGFEGATRFSGIAYLPREHADETRKQFEQMNVELGESAPFSQSVDGVDQVWWENMTVSRLSSPLMNVFICDYKDRRFNNRHAALDELQKRGGGPLGLLGLLSIQMVGQSLVDQSTGGQLHRRSA